MTVHEQRAPAETTSAADGFSHWDHVFASCLPQRSPEAAYYVARNLGADRESALDIAAQFRYPVFPALTTLELFLTDTCNLACTYCFVEGKNKRRHMTLQTAKESTELFLRESREMTLLNVVFMGGEPMVAHGMLTEFLPWLRSRASDAGKKLTLDMTTNGTLLTEERARFYASQRLKLLLSCDGGKQSNDLHRKTRTGKGTFDRVAKAIEILRRTQGFVGVKVTISPETVASLSADVRYLTGLGVGQFILGMVSGMDWPQASLDEYARQMRALLEWYLGLPTKHRPRIVPFERAQRSPQRNGRHSWGCRAGKNGIVVDPEGDIYGCSKILGANDGQGIPSLRLGHIATGLSETGTRAAMCGYTPTDRPACSNCFYMSSCLGGCFAVNFGETGDPFRPGSNCKAMALCENLEREFRRVQSMHEPAEESAAAPQRESTA